MRLRSPKWLVLAAVFAGACTPPIQAPTQFDELCSFIFAHADDEDPQGLADGIANLQTWLSTRRAEVEEGYVVDNLSDEVVKTFDGGDHDLTDLLGVAFATTFNASIEQSLDLGLNNDPATENPELWKKYERSNVGDIACFIEERCDTLDYDVNAEQIYPLGLESMVSYHSRLRRVDTPAGKAIIWRNWLNGPNQFNWDWVKVKLSFYLGIMVETAPGQFERTEASWILANMGDSPVPPDMALSLALDTVKAAAERHRTRLNELNGN